METITRTNCAPASALNSDQGEAQELTRVIERSSGVLYARALRQLRNPADAEDAVQDAFLSAYIHLKQFKNRSQLSTWLTTIVINSARTIVRRRGNRTMYSLDQPNGEQDDLTFSGQLSDHRPSPEEIFRQSEFAQVIAKMSMRLSPALRETFQLRAVHGLSIQEIAQIHGVPENTVKARIFRARIKLNDLVQKRVFRLAVPG